VWDEDAALREMLRRRLEGLGPVTSGRMAREIGLRDSHVEVALIGLETEGFVFRGHYSPSQPSVEPELEWCERRLLQRIHRYTIEAHRQSIKPVSLQSYMRYLFDLHEIKPQRLPVSAVSPLTNEGQAILQRSLERLDGLGAPAASWEADILSTRVRGYDPSWLGVT